jgi:hypothetical protein
LGGGVAIMAFQRQADGSTAGRPQPTTTHRARLLADNGDPVAALTKAVPETAVCETILVIS